MMTPGQTVRRAAKSPTAKSSAAKNNKVRRSEIFTRVAGAETTRAPFHVVRVALEGEGDSLLLELSEEAAMQLLAHLLKVLPKRGLSK